MNKLTQNCLNSPFMCAALLSMAIVLGLAGGLLLEAVVSSDAAVALLELARGWDGAWPFTTDSFSCPDEMHSFGIDLQSRPWSITMGLNYTNAQRTGHSLSRVSWSVPAFTTVGSDTYSTYLSSGIGTSLLSPQIECLQDLGLTGDAVSRIYLCDCYSHLELVTDGYIWNSFGLLALAGDIELNPGPIEKEELDAAIKLLEDSMTKKNEEALKNLGDRLSASMMMISKSIQSMTDKLEQIQGELGEVKNKLDYHEQFIEHISDRQGEHDTRLQRLEENLERQEQRSRRDNIILYNIPEKDGETFEDSEQKFIETVKEVLPNLLECKDIKRAHRIGKPAPHKVRPLIACLNRSSDKYAILQARNEFKKKSIGVSSDRTIKQRIQIREAREAGSLGHSDGNLRADNVPPSEGPGRGEPSDRYLTRSLARLREATNSR